MQKTKINLNRHHRRNLPHYEKEDAVYFMTSCLKGALPKEKVIYLKKRRAEEEQKLLQEGLCPSDLKVKMGNLAELYFGKFDALLDDPKNSIQQFKQEALAQIWNDALFFFDQKRYKVICSTIMSNHVHFIFYKLTHTLSSVMHSVKRYSGRKCNVLIDNVGHPFWQDENFDRIVRNRADLRKKILYVLNNPVKAKLVEDWRDWKWNYLHPDFEKFL